MHQIFKLFNVISNIKEKAKKEIEGDATWDLGLALLQFLTKEKK